MSILSGFRWGGQRLLNQKYGIATGRVFYRDIE